MPTVEDSVNVMMDHLKKAAESNKPFNIHPLDLFFNFKKLKFLAISMSLLWMSFVA